MSDKNREIKDENTDEEIVYDEEITSDKAQSKLQKLKKELKQCQAEKQEYLDGWQRSKADYINLKKRSEEDKERIRTYANEDLIVELLSVLDSFEMAFKDQEAWNNAPENWRRGIEYIHGQFEKVLYDFSVTVIDPKGDKFDPNLHHSTEMIETNNKKEDGVILEVNQKGYKLKDKIIRVPSVKVGELEK
jgi:molecular chaperone GrpE